MSLKCSSVEMQASPSLILQSGWIAEILSLNSHKCIWESTNRGLIFTVIFHWILPGGYVKSIPPDL